MDTHDTSLQAHTIIKQSRVTQRGLSVGQLRIATVPTAVRSERNGVFDPAWLIPRPCKKAPAAASRR